MELAIPAPNKHVSVEEYLRLSANSSTKMEFRDGEVLDMAGAKPDHNRIAANIVRELGNALKGGPCEVLGGDQRVLTADDRYAYPDVTVVCEPLQFDPRDPDMTITNPKLVVEILSPSTELNDRGEKLLRYLNLPSLQEYMLVWQDLPRVQSFYRDTDGRWMGVSVFESLEQSARFHSLKIEIPMTEIYANVAFSAGDGQ